MTRKTRGIIEWLQDAVQTLRKNVVELQKQVRNISGLLSCADIPVAVRVSKRHDVTSLVSIPILQAYYSHNGSIHETSMYIKDDLFDKLIAIPRLMATEIVNTEKQIIFSVTDMEGEDHMFMVDKASGCLIDFPNDIVVQIDRKA